MIKPYDMIIVNSSIYFIPNISCEVKYDIEKTGLRNIKIHNDKKERFIVYLAVIFFPINPQEHGIRAILWPPMRSSTGPREKF